MSAEVQQFTFNGSAFRALNDESGESWFSGQDVCNILGTGTNHLREYLDEDEITNIRNTDIAQNGGKAPVFISEPGLYKLIMRSRKPEAKEFQRWVTHEVLPSIRKHGAYMTQQTLDKALTSPDFLIQLATKLKEEQEKVKELEPKAKALDDFTNVPDALLVRDAAKLLSNDSNIQIGEHELRQWLVDNGWIYPAVQPVMVRGVKSREARPHGHGVLPFPRNPQGWHAIRLSADPETDPQGIGAYPPAVVRTKFRASA